MKKRTKSFLTIVLSCLLVLGLSTGIFAADYPVWVGGHQFNDSNLETGIPCGDGIAKLKLPKSNKEPYILTLENATIVNELNSEKYDNMGIYSTRNCDIVLIGENKTTNRNRRAMIYINGSCTISGSGSLFASDGIFAGDDLVMNGTGKVQTYAEYPAFRADGNITINSGHVRVECHDKNSPVFCKGVLTVNGGCLDAEGNSYDSTRRATAFTTNGGFALNVPITYAADYRDNEADISKLSVRKVKDPTELFKEVYKHYFISSENHLGTISHITIGRLPDEYDVFTDRNEWSWAEPYIIFTIDNKLMYGVSNTDFGSTDEVTRAQLVTILHRMVGEPEPSSLETAFSDVPQDQWYSKAIAWAVENKIAYGVGDGRFGTTDPVTRQDVVTFFWRYEKEPVSEQDLSKFNDAAEISPYAEKALCWAVEHSIVNGMGDGSLSPKGTATRGQIAKIITDYAKLCYPEKEWIIK